ncbi:integrase [Nonomuraea sp. WAC 01424]|uniref:site-specific integrase n=1 Tax=Nonomuraea sp. WAC 01424 TaxID=2203200 RepID=UPI000F776954|nr:site-specific integrase [Nonomuraea sp. WAC 01424]RSN02944.1 integrase [Nonomuraea sp. WAC 01424]
MTPGSAASRWLQGPHVPDPTRVHVHRRGSHDSLPAAAVVNLLPGLAYWDRSAKTTHSLQRLGVKALLAWLTTFPGDGWQERWIAAGADTLPWSDTRSRLPIPDRRAQVVAALRPLLLLRVIAPSYDLFRTYRSCGLVTNAWEILYTGDERRRVAQAMDALKIAGRHRHEIAHALTKLLLHTGASIDAVTAEDIFELWSWSIARQVHVPGLHGAWEVASKIGAISGEQTLRGALRAGPRPTEELVDRYGLEHRHIRDLLVRYLNERRPALDYSSFLTLVGVLAGAFWGDIERHHPEQDSIHLPDAIAQAWKERLTTWTDWRTGRRRPRSIADQMWIKVKVRGFYLDLQKWAPEDPHWAAWVVPCPIRKSEVAGLAKLRRASSAQIHQRIRDRLPRLGELVDAAESARAEQQHLLAAALTVSAGDIFQCHGRAYQRFVHDAHTIGPSVRRPGLPDVMATDVEAGEQLNLSVSEENAFWAWAIIEILRHTGIRLEELLELTHLALVSYQLPATDEIVPLLQIVPSKTDAERLLLVPPELASVLAQVITRLRNEDGSVPLVSRYDPYERRTGPPLPHLMQRRRGWRRETFSPHYIDRLLNAVVERAGIRDAAGQPIRYTPHDFRRIFATEAVTGGLPVHIAAKILGHDHLGTAQHYLAVFQEDLIRAYQDFLRARACIRCPMLQVNPRERPRLMEIVDSLRARIDEAQNRGWLGEAHGLGASLEAAEAKLASLDRRGRVDLGLPSMRYRD